jgi:hypothetical protein
MAKALPKLSVANESKRLSRKPLLRKFPMFGEHGVYDVTPNDLPAYEICQCGAKGREVCVRSLQAGEQNNRPWLVLFLLLLGLDGSDKTYIPFK